MGLSFFAGGVSVLLYPRWLRSRARGMDEDEHTLAHAIWNNGRRTVLTSVAILIAFLAFGVAAGNLDDVLATISVLSD